MAGITVDVTVANRFMSSLSKSLQALCHGCMEFDSGIEIVGYINVNIDSGSTMDYVLNEKVQKSQNNSMTFVSNSFFAKKEKQLKDGSCSPIHELHQDISEPLNNTLNTPDSHLSQKFHRPNKRRSGGREKDWSLPSKKYSRSLNPDLKHGTPYHSSHSQHVQTPLSSKYQSDSQLSHSASKDCVDVCVKQEDADSDQNNFSQTCDDGYSEGNVSVKPDPDYVQCSENDEQTDASELTNNFLQYHADEISQQQTASTSTIPDGDNVSGNLTNVSESVEFHDASNTEGDSYHQTSFQGETSADFECIEIDDEEDEEFQAFFGANRKYNLISCI